MQRLSDHEVICPCVKCGKVLSAFCGLDLPITWIGQVSPKVPVLGRDILLP